MKKLSLLLIIVILNCTAIVYCEEASQDHITVDLKKCHFTGTLYRGMGSTGITTIRKESDSCILMMTDELEGGYTKFECKMPESLNQFIVNNPKGNDVAVEFSINIQNYCKKIESGNVFLGPDKSGNNLKENTYRKDKDK